MEIRLKNEWMGHKKGTKLNLVEVAAKRLVNNGTAEFITSKQSKKPEKEEVKKAISEPPKDKMVRRPTRKK